MQYTFDDNKRFIDETKRNIWNNHVDLLECCEYGFSNKLLQRLLFIYGVNCKDINDDIPLLWACRDGRTMTAKRLIEFGADINHGQNSSRLFQSNFNINRSSILIKMLTTSRGTRFKTVLLLIRKVVLILILRIRLVMVLILIMVRMHFIKHLQGTYLINIIIHHG